MPKTMISKLPLCPSNLRQPVLQPLLEDGDQAGAQHGAPDVADAADDGHEQVFDALRQPEGGRVNEALQMSVEPAGNTGEQGGDQEDHDLDRGVLTPIASAITVPPLSARMARPIA
jgi:hypothetical protein